MTNEPTSPRGLLLLAGLMLLTTSLAGCFSSQNTTPSTSGPDQSACPSRGSSSPKVVNQNYLTHDTTWKPDPSKSVDVKVKTSGALHLNGYQLTVKPCTIVEVVEGAGIDATRSDSRLMIVGAPDKEVHLQSAVPQRDHWGPIRLHMSSTSSHVVEHAVIEDGGRSIHGTSSDDGMLQVLNIDESANVRIANVTLRDSFTQGLLLEASSHLDPSSRLPSVEFENNTITDNGQEGVNVDSRLARVLDSRSDYEGNDGHDVHVLPSEGYVNMAGRHVWNPLGVPYTVHTKPDKFGGGLTVRGQLELRPGTTLAFEEGSDGLDVLGKGPTPQTAGLLALGAPERDVTFTGVTKIPGSWGGIRIRGEHTMNRLEHTDVSFGGGEPTHEVETYQAGANIALLPDPTVSKGFFDGYWVRLQGVTSAFSSGDGLLVGNSSNINLQMSDLEFGLNDEHPMAIGVANVEEVAPSTQVLGPQPQGVALLGHAVSPRLDVRIPAIDHHYYAQQGLRNPGGELTLPAGTHIEFAKGSGFTVEGSSNTAGLAVLKARGTSSDPVILEGATSQPGFWKGVYLGTQSTDNVLEHTKIRHGGSDSWRAKTCGNAAVYNAGIDQGGNLVIGDDCPTGGIPVGKVAWKSGSSTQHPGTMAGIWANECDQIWLKTSGSPQVSYTNFDTGDVNPGPGCPPQSN